MARLGAIKEEIGADALNLETEGVKGLSNAGPLRGNSCHAGEHPFPCRHSTSNMDVAVDVHFNVPDVVDVWPDIPTTNVANVFSAREHTASTRAI